MRDLLIQASLSPPVRVIDYLPRVAVRGISVQIDAIIFDMRDGRYLIDYPDDRSPRDPDADALRSEGIEQIGLPVKKVAVEQLRAWPHAENARMVWACRDHRVAVGDRVRVLEALRDDGPFPLAHAASLIRFSADSVAALLALACSDLVELELVEQPLGPETPVRRRQLEDRF